MARPRGVEKVHDACILPYVRFILVRAMPTLHVRVGKEHARAHGAALHTSMRAVHMACQASLCRKQTRRLAPGAFAPAAAGKGSGVKNGDSGQETEGDSFRVVASAVQDRREGKGESAKNASSNLTAVPEAGLQHAAGLQLLLEHAQDESEELREKNVSLMDALKTARTHNKALKEEIVRLTHDMSILSPGQTNQGGGAEQMRQRDRAVLNLAHAAGAYERQELTWQDLIATMMTSGVTLLNADRISIFLVDQVRQEFWLAASEDGVDIRVPLTSGVCGECYRTRSVLNVENCSASPWFNKTVDDLTAYVTRSLICVPIFDSVNGSTVVAVAEALNKFDAKTGDIIGFSETDCDTLMALGSELGIALKHKTLEVSYQRILQQRGEEDRSLRSMLELYSPDTSSTARTMRQRQIRHSTHSVSLPSLYKQNLFSLVQEGGIGASDATDGSGTACQPSAPSLLMRGSLLKRAQESTGSNALKLTWDFDVFSATEEQLVMYVVEVYKERGLTSTFKIDDATLVNFVTAVAKRYHDHPFHNFRHGFSVMQTAYILLRDGGMAEAVSAVDVLAAITSALCHDIDHPGVSNEHLIASGSGLALLYNDRAVLENHHTFTMFDLLLKPQYNILANLLQDEYVECRKTMISCIMATDMKVHVTLCSRLQASAFKFFETGVFPYNTGVHSDREQMLEALVHACDLSGQTMTPKLAAQWEQRVLAEFMKQASEEESKGLPVAPFMQGLDNRLVQVKTQIAFINYAVRPV